MAEHDAAAPGPRISIVTPVRNAAATLERCLASVAADKGLVIEHIVVDGQSTDGSRDILRACEGDFLRVIDAPSIAVSWPHGAIGSGSSTGTTGTSRARWRRSRPPCLMAP
jgi:cellulose synthase/poly-beta-1,6-N-acetylglucosamine synthase-like glycosyltransferase